MWLIIGYLGFRYVGCVFAVFTSRIPWPFPEASTVKSWSRGTCVTLSIGEITGSENYMKNRQWKGQPNMMKNGMAKKKKRAQEWAQWKGKFSVTDPRGTCHMSQMTGEGPAYIRATGNTEVHPQAHVRRRGFFDQVLRQSLQYHHGGLREKEEDSASCAGYHARLGSFIALQHH